MNELLPSPPQRNGHFELLAGGKKFSSTQSSESVEAPPLLAKAILRPSGRIVMGRMPHLFCNPPQVPDSQIGRLRGAEHDVSPIGGPRVIPARCPLFRFPEAPNLLGIST